MPLLRLLLKILFFITATRLLAANAPLATPTEEAQVRLTNMPTRQEKRVFKATPADELVLHLFLPQEGKASARRPAIVFFHGAGGGAKRFFPQAEYFASRGMICVAVDYPIFRGDGKVNRLDENVGHAKSAMRWLRAHADELEVDAKKVVAVGSSMGGALALLTVLSPEFDSAADNRTISCEPNALVLFAPVVRFPDTLLNAAGDPIAKSVSAALFLKQNMPPAIVFFGTADNWGKAGGKFVTDSKALGNRCEYFTAADQPHGFHNKEPWTTATAHEVDRFLVSLGYLSGVPTLAPANAALMAVK